MKHQKNLNMEENWNIPAACTTELSNSLIETIGCSAGKYICESTLSLLWANSHFYKSIGFAKEEFHSLFRTLTQYFTNHLQELDKLKDAARTAMELAQTSFTVDYRMPSKNGSFIWVRTRGTFTGEMIEGHPVFLAVHSDITDLVLEKDRQRQYFEWILEEYEGNAYVSDIDTYELLYVNQTSLDTLKAREEDVIGRKCYEVIQGRTSPCPFCTNSKLNPNEVYKWEFFNPVLDRTFMIKNKLIIWDGHTARIELSHDMYSTEFKLAKKDRERDALLKSIPGGSARLDARDYSTILWYGAEFLNLIGYTKEQFETELHSQCTYVHPDDLERLIPIMENMQSSGKSMITEVRIITRSGETRILTLTLSYAAAEDSWDGIPSFYSLGIDVTAERLEQERQRKALEDAYQAARIASSAKTNFLSSMSHDIRTPMNAIMGMTAIAQMNLTSPDKVHDCLSKINVSSRHLLGLINEVLDMSKIESGKIDLAPEEIHLPELIQNISDICRPLISKKQLELNISVCDVQHETIIADGDRLQQVLMNLLSNSIKYTPEGGTVSMRIKEGSSPIESKGQFEFSFTDNGIGMPEEFIPHLFEPFSRAADSRISKIQGTGLGMAITENIVCMMNGSIDVKSELNKGSQFTVTLPFELIDEEFSCDSELMGLPILVVDDDKATCVNVAALLNELGMRGYWVLSGEEAIIRVCEAHECSDDFSAVILDWKMPEMDGMTTLKTIRQKLGKDVPVIIISAYDYSNIEEEFLQAGADAFITKPLFKSKVLHVLHMLLSSGRVDTSNMRMEETPSGLFGKRALLVEDNDLNREIALELLQMQGMIVEYAENGKRALDMFEESSSKYYDVILMDIQMPVMDGYEATEKIRSLKRKDAKSIPILALTANAFTADIGKAYNVGINEHIPKPIDVNFLIEILQKYIG